jgi:DNA-binding CsgD family transcriptional regulator
MLSERFLQATYGLTASEARLTVRMLAGQSLREASRALNIQYETARTRLKFIFQKTGARRQAELVILLARAAIIGGAQSGAQPRRTRSDKSDSTTRQSPQMGADSVAASMRIAVVREKALLRSSNVQRKSGLGPHGPRTKKL